MSEPSTTVADQLATELETDGTLVARGGLEKLGRYQLADPSHYILRLAEAGARLGAEQVGFWIGSDELVVRYLHHGEPITLPSDLHRRLLWVLVGEIDALGEVDREAIVQLAIGVNAAISRGHGQVWVDSVGADRRGFRLAFDGRKQSFLPIEDGDPGLSVQVRGHRRGLVRPMLESRAELSLLCERVRWARTPFYFDDTCISDHRLVKGTPVVDGNGDTIGEATFDQGEPPPPACVVLLAGGVEIERVYPPDARPGFLAVVEAALPRDLSRSEFIRGPEFDALIARVLDYQSHITPTPTEVKSGDLAILSFPLTPKGRRRARAVGVLAMLALLTTIVFSTLGVSESLLVMGIAATMVITWLLTFVWTSGPRELTERINYRSPLRAPVRPAVATLAPNALPPDTKQLREVGDPA